MTQSFEDRAALLEARAETAKEAPIFERPALIGALVDDVAALLRDMGRVIDLIQKGGA